MFRGARRPTQAVIFAGGRGTRLGTLTDDVPKPMVEVAGRPFVDHLLGLLHGQGMDRAVLLLGYRAEVLARHVAHHAPPGMAVTCLTTPPEVHTLTRLRAAEHLLDDVVLVAYCDNYVPLDLAQMWAEFAGSGAAVQVTAYHNADGYSRSNLAADPNGWVHTYDPTRTAEGLTCVDLGFALIDRTRLGPLPDRDEQFEHALYPGLAAAGRLRAHVTEHRYYGIGSQERLPAAQRFFTRGPAVLLDRDGVLNERAAPGHYVVEPAGFVWLDGALDALRLLTEAGCTVLVVTNQAGVARGVMTAEQLAVVHRAMIDGAEAAGGRIDGIYACTHGWDDGCRCRKPAPGLLLAAQREHDLDLSRTVFVGDDERDARAARAAGCPYRHVDADHSLLDHVRELAAAVAR